MPTSPATSPALAPSLSLSRRHFTRLAGALIGASLAAPRLSFAAGNGDSQFAQALEAIEARIQARLGAFVLDTETGTTLGYRADERFPMCSTFKAIAAAAVLSRVDAGKEDLSRRLHWKKADLIAHSPVTEKHVKDGLTLTELCHAATTVSDNTAANLMLEAIGGPSGFTAFVRSVGDPVTRIDRMEPALNSAKPGDKRDTTSPAAMAALLKTLVLDDALSPASRDQLGQWMVANTTGGTKLRAGLPRGFTVGDRTGAGANGTNNVVAVIWPPQRKPLVATVFITETQTPRPETDPAMAEIGRLLTRILEI
ncbi:beta-lactamase [Rhizobium sp. PDO1-076]|uniref:class A beta-lactamase n=1 Tax=Rhizobium sp. PDO1-076 TaxID=1125979 RepID=UPI00024E3022|nr:class A beta-lactamase [Rhizobium sp. PDO1-076]EHS54118.1 beta-lactamase [Rhizobium sp. PDO1-076]